MLQWPAGTTWQATLVQDKCKGNAYSGDTSVSRSRPTSKPSPPAKERLVDLLLSDFLFPDPKGARALEHNQGIEIEIFGEEPLGHRQVYDLMGKLSLEAYSPL